MQRNNFETHTQRYLNERKGRDKREAHLGEDNTQPDYFLYTVMIGLIVFFSIIGIALWLNK